MKANENPNPSMLRTILLVLFISFVQNGLAQTRKFDQFSDELDHYSAEHPATQFPDSTVNMEAYEIKWTEVKATYGGSPFCCGGQVFGPDLELDSLFKGTGYYQDATILTAQALEVATDFIGERFIIERSEYSEPRPTSAFHYVYVTRYYERKGPN